jgi:PST family polysaccharide transporter
MSLRERVWSGVLWTSLGTVLKYGSQLAVSVIVARILSPSDYGLIAMVMAVHGVLIPLVSLDIGTALIRQESLSPRWVATAFWMSVALGLSATVLLVALAPLIAAFYEQPQLTAIGQVLALGFCIGALGSVPQALLRRELRFRTLSQAEIASVAFSGVITVWLVLEGFGVWALAVQGMLQSAALGVLAWFATGFRPMLAFDRQVLRGLFRFGVFASGADLAIMFAASGAHLIIGRALGASDLGLYMRALGLAQLVVSVVHTAASSVILPALAHVREEPERFRSLCLRASGLAALVLAPALAAFIAVPDVTLVFLYGPTWSAASDPLRVLAFPILMYGTITAFAAIFPALARTDLALRWSIITGVLIVIGTWLGSYLGTPSGVALGHVATLLVFLPRIASAGGLVGMRALDYLKVVRAPFFCGVVTAAVVAVVRHALRDAPFALMTAGVIASGAVTYAGLALGLRIEAVRSLRQLVGR